MSTLEDRLGAALAARADLVQPEDLRPGSPPPVQVPLRHRPVAYLVAAAACAAAVSAPFLVNGGGEDRPAPPVDTPSAPVTPNGDQVEGAAWPQAYDYPRGYDVDGDGVPDRIVIRTPSDEELPHGVRRFEVHLSTGGVAAVLLDYDTYDLTAVTRVELDGEPGDEILYYRGTEKGEMGVLDLVDGALVDLEVPDDPGLTSEPDEQFRDRGRWVEDRRLYSYRTVEGGFVPGGSAPSKPPHRVDVWEWVLREGRLVPVPGARRCLDPVVHIEPYPC